MEKIGFSIRFYPTDVIDGEANLSIDRNVWENGKIITATQTAIIPMKADLQALAKVHEGAWILSILELAGYAIADAIIGQSGGWNSGACASPIRASETLTEE